ncbi:MAG: DUF4157 domain-containing protein [Iphinoe sp. HA4291-MV1]|nr:DUF4157 domain-containing protein [Iphinoe sp. HA4291-MV1]
MQRQHQSETKNAITTSNKENAIDQHSPHPIEELQSAIGNRAVNQLLKTQQTISPQPTLQAKFRGLSGELTENLQQQGEVLPKASGGGKKIPEAVQQKMETAFGTDFSDVRIHEGKEAESIGAIAYTRGQNIHFAPGKYDPNSQTGQKLLGHELTHVMQQQAGQVAAPQGKDIPINVEPQLEHEADVLGAKAAQGKQVQVAGAGTRLESTVALDAGQVVQCGRTPGLLKTPARHLKKKLLALHGLGHALAGNLNRAVAISRQIKRIEQKLNADKMRRNPPNFKSTVDEMNSSSQVSGLAEGEEQLQEFQQELASLGESESEKEGSLTEEEKFEIKEG